MSRYDAELLFSESHPAATEPGGGIPPLELKEEWIRQCAAEILKLRRPVWLIRDAVHFSIAPLCIGAAFAGIVIGANTVQTGFSSNNLETIAYAAACGVLFGILITPSFSFSKPSKRRILALMSEFERKWYEKREARMRNYNAWRYRHQ